MLRLIIKKDIIRHKNAYKYNWWVLHTRYFIFESLSVWKYSINLDESLYSVVMMKRLQITVFYIIANIWH